MVAATLVYVWVGEFADLVDLLAPIMTLTTTLVAVGVLVQRVRAPARERPFRVPAAPLVVALQVLLGLFLLASYFADDWRHGARGLRFDLGALAVGAVAYALCCRRPPAAA